MAESNVVRQAETATRQSYGYYWSEVFTRSELALGNNHFARMAEALRLEIPADAHRILDAGCGPGLDSAVVAQAQPQRLVVGLELSAGVTVAAERFRGIVNAQAVQGSVLAAPFKAASFDLVYSYGVLHHTRAPAAGFSELARLVDRGGVLAIYVYSDLREEPLLGFAIRLVTALRRATVKVPPRTMARLCDAAAPGIFVLFGIPAQILRRVGAESAAARLPFNWVRTPKGASGDLFDRFATTIEHRHNEAEIREWYRRAGFGDVVVTTMPGARGWVAAGRRQER